MRSFCATVYYHLTGPPSYMRSVVDRNVVMRRISYGNEHSAYINCGEFLDCMGKD